MRKRFLPFALMAACMMGSTSVHAQAYSSTATSQVYDFRGFNEVTLLNLFHEVHLAGRKFPTKEEFERVGIQASDIAFVRSHVAKRPIMSRADRLVSDTYEKRNLFMNIPGGSGKGLGGYPSSNFANDVFSMWNYTNLFGNWNHGLFQAPGAWTDAAHKNGTTILCGIKFFEYWTDGSGDSQYTNFITAKNDDGSFKYVKPLINCLIYFGFDGINYNWEDHSYGNAEVTAFHKALYKEAQAQNFTDFHAALYTQQSRLTSTNANQLFGDHTGRTFHTFLNYAGNDFASDFGASVRAAETAMGTSDGIYGGVWIVTMNRSWDRLLGGRRWNPSTYSYETVADDDTKKMGVCLWGEHGDSRFWSNTLGSDAIDAQANYQRLLEKGFSGGNRSPIARPAVTTAGSRKNLAWDGANPLGDFCGLATFIPERSAIQGNLPFLTHFNLGNGERYNYKGKKTAGSWYNMASQDVVPTYRWLIYDKGTESRNTAIQPEFTHLDSYNGGSCLLLQGKSASTGADIVLYKTSLNVSAGNAKAKVAVKGAAGDTKLSVIVKVGNEWKEVAVGSKATTGWEEMTLNLPVNTGDVITRIGLRVNDINSDYKMMVGKLELSDDYRVAPSNVKDLMVEVKEESKKSLSAKLYWDVEATGRVRADWGLVYNDEANISHFEILYKNGETGRVSEVGRTTQWGTYIPNLPMGENERPFIGVRAVSTDLKTYSPVQWVEITRADMNALPAETAGGTDTYGISRVNTAAAGYKVAVQQRYLTSVTTTGADQNINFTASAAPADSSQYMNARSHVLKVTQGQRVTINLKTLSQTQASDGMRYCFAGGWIDLDGSGTFNYPDPVQRTDAEIAKGKTSTHPWGERIFFIGTPSAATPAIQSPEGMTFHFDIPSDAHVGKSRLRIVFTDAWFGGTFLPTGLTAKGYTIDFDVEIQGTEAGQRTFVDTHDQGVAEEPEGLAATTGVENTVYAGGISQVAINNGEVAFKNVEKAWIYTTDGKLVKFLNTPNTVNVNEFAAGVYVVKMQYKNVFRTEKLVIK